MVAAVLAPPPLEDFDAVPEFEVMAAW